MLERLEGPGAESRGASASLTGSLAPLSVEAEVATLVTEPDPTLVTESTAMEVGTKSATVDVASVDVATVATTPAAEAADAEPVGMDLMFAC